MSGAARTARLDAWLWMAQRATAVVLALCVTVHLVTIMVAVRGGLDGAEIVARVGGNVTWLAFYLLFVGAAAVHAAIGLRAVLRETTRLPAAAVDCIALLAGLLLLLGGGNAVLLLYGAGA